MSSAFFVPTLTMLESCKYGSCQPLLSLYILYTPVCRTFFLSTSGKRWLSVRAVCRHGAESCEIVIIKPYEDLYSNNLDILHTKYDHSQYHRHISQR